jgi:IS30 family transposase
MARSYHHLTLSERVLIETQLSLGLRASAIAASLQRAGSTVVRGLRRSNPLRVEGRYRALPAESKAALLSSRPRVVRRLRPGEPLWDTVIGHLRRGLSPQQIAHTLARMPDPARLSHETIYTSLYAMPRGELRASLLALLRRGHKARRSRKGGKGGEERRNRAIPEMVLIDQRPVEVAMRLVPGHWEGDLIIGKGNRSQVGTLVERTTLFVALVKLDNARGATVAAGFSTILNRFDSQLAAP